MAQNNEDKYEVVDENPASQRHWVYGFNAAVLIVVGLVALVFLLVICSLQAVDEKTKWDISSNGSNSLSPGTRKMLEEVGKSKDSYTIWSLFTDASDQMKRDEPEKAAEQSRRRQQVRDLLNQYQRASGKITVEDRGEMARDAIEKEIAKKYDADFQPYRDAVKGYGPVMDHLSKFLTTEAAAIGANGQKAGTSAEEREAAAMIQAQFAQAPAELQQDQKMIQRETDTSTLPDWGMLTNRIKSTISDLEPLFGLLSDAKKLKDAGFPQSLQEYFAANAEGYKKMDQELKDYLGKLEKLEPLKVQDVLSSLSRNAVVIMNDKSAKVVSQFDIYKEAPGGQTGGGIQFNGEQAISSALLAMAKPDKVKVVFVSASSQHLLDDAYSDMKAVLEEANFEALEWSPTSEPSQPGMPAPPSSPPPASGKGVVWVVFTPDMPNMQMMMMGAGMPDTKPVIEATRKHMDAGGQVLFMADASGGMMGPGSFAYADLVKDFGIDVQSKYSVVHLREQTNPNTGAKTSVIFPYLGLDDDLTFAKHEITSALNGEPTVFGPMRTNQGSVGQTTVVKVLNPVPTGVSAMELVKTPVGPEYWGETDLSPDSKFTKGTDYDSPVPVMVVAVKDKGAKAADGTSNEKRVAVIGAKMIGSNFFLEVTQDQVVGNVIYRRQQFPGNEDLMKNTILWLAGYENMIAVSAKSNAASRIGAVSPTQLLLVRLGTIIFVPLLALVLGAVVWAARRK